MKKVLIVLLIGLLLSQTASAEVYYRRKGTNTNIQFANVIASTGVITTGATFGLTCGCVVEGSALALSNGCCTSNGNRAGGADAACTGATAATEIAGTGLYNLAINAGDMGGAAATANDYCFVKAVAATIAGSVDHLFEIRTAQYTSYEDVTSMTATQPAVKHVGNTTGQGEVVQGGNAAAAAYYVSGGAEGIKVYSSSTGISVESANTAAIKALAAGGQPAFWGIGGSSASAAGGPAILLTGGASTWNNVAGKGGAAISATTGASHATATSWNPTIALTAVGTNADTLRLTPTGTGVGINCGSAVCFNPTLSVRGGKASNL